MLVSTVGPSDSEYQMVTTRNMSLEDSTKIIRVLQQQMMEMQQRYEGELATLRAKNSTSVAKEKATDTKVRESGMKTVLEESTTISWEHHMVKTEHTTRMLSFVPTIMEV
ncbi:hypothetical protein LR48_Vigan10g136300 [Vigna angularis]|uniref:Uncharacterized protein n=1 Tax=Phaseolus angularis TaxID=3914 RepID=A0A0L9VKB4_PHAAN|nr:hypothetical protein LR48_Vigan10g136300 [Vigna angularis]